MNCLRPASKLAVQSLFVLAGLIVLIFLSIGWSRSKTSEITVVGGDWGMSPRLFGKEIHRLAMVGDLAKLSKLVTRYPASIDQTAKLTFLATDTPAEFGTIQGITALHIAARNNHKEIVELLLDHGADVAVKDTDGSTPLHYAAKHKHIVELLLDHGANVTAAAANGRTPLHCAAASGEVESKEVVALLLSHGADINAKTRYGWTPLHVVVGRNVRATETLELLLTRGADVNAADKHGRTPLDLALEMNRHDHAGLLRKHGAKEKAPDGQN